MTTNGRGRPPHDDVLTPAEWRVSEQVRHGLTNRQIANRMNVSTDAVKFHVGNALSKLGFASRAELRSWNGISKGTALYARRRSAVDDQREGSVRMVLGQVARTTKDFEASHSWYRYVLELPELYCFGKLAFFDLGGVRLMLGEEEGGNVAESILYLSVADIHAAKAALEDKGVEFINAPHLIHRHEDGTEEWMSGFYDNERRVLMLMSRVAPGLGA